MDSSNSNSSSSKNVWLGGTKSYWVNKSLSAQHPPPFQPPPSGVPQEWQSPPTANANTNSASPCSMNSYGPAPTQDTINQQMSNMLHHNLLEIGLAHKDREIRALQASFSELSAKLSTMSEKMNSMNRKVERLERTAGKLKKKRTIRGSRPFQILLCFGTHPQYLNVSLENDFSGGLNDALNNEADEEMEDLNEKPEDADENMEDEDREVG